MREIETQEPYSRVTNRTAPGAVQCIYKDDKDIFVDIKTHGTQYTFQPLTPKE